MTIGETSTINYLRSIMYIQEDATLDFDHMMVYLDDPNSQLQPVGTVMNFFQSHLQIYDITRVIGRIFNEIYPDVDFVPWSRNDIIPQGAIQKSTVTYHIDTMLPARINQQNYAERREMGPRYRYCIRDYSAPEVPIIDVYGQLVDNVLQFRFYGRSATESEQLAIGFRSMMQVFAGSIQTLGAPIVQWQQGGILRPEQLSATETHTPLFLEYLIRTEDLYTFDAKLIKLIEVNVKTETGGL